MLFQHGALRGGRTEISGGTILCMSSRSECVILRRDESPPFQSSAMRESPARDNFAVSRFDEYIIFNV